MTRTVVLRARALRTNSTDAERLLWRYLRNAQLGAKFRRQRPIEQFIVDFVCLEARLIVEVDGGQHAEHAAYDEKRSTVLQSLGYRVLRFWNTDVLQNIEGVVVVIAAHLARKDGAASTRETPP